MRRCSEKKKDMRKILLLFILLPLTFAANSQADSAVRRFLSAPYMKGASVSICIRDVAADSIIYGYDAEREVVPASVMKIVTTSAALEILGENFRFETALMYDGNIENGVLNGNLYICGGGDPTTGSADAGDDKNAVFREWISAVKQAGIKKINGAVIADESIFDTEGVSMKWMREDLGSYYGQGCYGLNIFDNRYSLVLKTGQAGSRPEITATKPDMNGLAFHNYLVASDKAERDSIYITGFPYSNERYLYGAVPANKTNITVEGDIPEPALFLSEYFVKMLHGEHIAVSGKSSCHRILAQEGMWHPQNRKLLTTTYSKPLKELIKITNRVSSNLYADAFLKTAGLKYRGNEVISSFDRGVRTIQKHWQEKGIDVSSLRMHDGSGLAPTDRLTAKILCDILSCMAAKSAYSKTFTESIPKAGLEGTVRNTLKGSRLQGVARLKSGSMSLVRSYAGYVAKDGKQYTVAILVNNFACKQNQIKQDIERLLLALFP
jgi:D-alanyl-D-alanine carboxypeptidase/D-alanyl-D-alanine-endopeptidase (penicillin-binding protein 4)